MVLKSKNHGHHSKDAVQVYKEMCSDQEEILSKSAQVDIDKKLQSTAQEKAHLIQL